MDLLIDEKSYSKPGPLSKLVFVRELFASCSWYATDVAYGCSVGAPVNSGYVSFAALWQGVESRTLLDAGDKARMVSTCFIEAISLFGFPVHGPLRDVYSYPIGLEFLHSHKPRAVPQRYLSDSSRYWPGPSDDGGQILRQIQFRDDMRPQDFYCDMP